MRVSFVLIIVWDLLTSGDFGPLFIHVSGQSRSYQTELCLISSKVYNSAVVSKVLLAINIIGYRLHGLVSQMATDSLVTPPRIHSTLTWPTPFSTLSVSSNVVGLRGEYNNIWSPAPHNCAFRRIPEPTGFWQITFQCHCHSHAAFVLLEYGNSACISETY
jgi:hypothetical protein